MPNKGMAMLDRFCALFVRGDMNECWLWTGNADKNGYGLFKRDGVRLEFAHRVSYAMATGDELVGKCCLHHCDTPSCVNPFHLFSGSQQDNLEDMCNKRKTGAG
jgi:hypothetical protein